jgi:hypothetical protein
MAFQSAYVAKLMIRMEKFSEFLGDSTDSVLLKLVEGFRKTNLSIHTCAVIDRLMGKFQLDIGYYTYVYSSRLWNNYLREYENENEIQGENKYKLKTLKIYS